MSSTSESATGSNKRRRTNGNANNGTTRRTGSDGRAVNHPTSIDNATNPPDPHQLIGTRLEPIMGDLASQPKKFQTTLIEFQHSMLDKLASIKQRKSSYLRHTKPVIDPKTGEVSLDDDGAPKKFVPNSCRAKCPVEASESFRDDPRVVTKLEAARKEHEAWRLKMAQFCKEMSWLEIEIREEELRKEFFAYTHAVAKSRYMAESRRATIPTQDSAYTNAYSKDEWGHLISHEILCTCSDDEAEFFDFFPDDDADDGMNLTEPSASEQPTNGAGRNGAAKLGGQYLKDMNFDLEATKKKSKHPVKDKATITELVAKTATFVRHSTISFWIERDLEAIEREIDAELEREFKPKSITKATEAAALVLDQIDLANPPKPLDDYIDKRIKEGNTKLRRELRNAKRLNCSGDNATQESKPTKNGTSSKKVRFESSTTSSNAPSKKKKKKKVKKATAAPSNQNPPTPPKKKSKKPKKKDTGSRGGSKGGGNPKGAGRR